MTSSHKPTAGFWITVALVVVLAGYPLSFGPACWWISTPAPMDIGYSAIQYNTVSRFYWPIGWLAKHGPNPVGRFILWYATLRVEHVMLPCDASGRSNLDH